MLESEEAALIKVKTTRFGEIDVKTEDLIELPNGLIGFPEPNYCRIRPTLLLMSPHEHLAFRQAAACFRRT